MLHTRHHSLTRARAVGATLAASALVLAAAACKDSGIKPDQATATPSAPAVVATETTTVPPAEATPAVPANVSYAEAESVFKAKQYGQAADMFAAYATTHEKNPWGFYMLGLSAWKGGQLDRAQKAFEDALATPPFQDGGLERREIQVSGNGRVACHSSHCPRRRRRTVPQNSAQKAKGPSPASGDGPC